MSKSFQQNQPPGQQRPYPCPTRTGNITFRPPGTDLVCSTSYYLWGSLDSKLTPLVCLHGGPGATSVYMRPFSLLSSDYGLPVIIYDQLGCGGSTRLRDRKGDTEFWGIDLFVAELLNLIATLHLTTFDLLGHSWGGLVACKLAANQCTGLRKLVIANSTADMAHKVEVFKQDMAKLPLPFCDAVRRVEQGGSEDTPEYQAALEEYDRQTMCRLQPWPQEMLDCMAAFAEDDTVSSTLHESLNSLDIRPDLRKLSMQSVPGGILLMNSKYDQSTDELVLPFFLLPSARVKWVRFAMGGHLTILDETESVLAATGKFLTSDC